MAESDGLTGLDETCKAIVKGSAGVLEWEWDERFGAALSVFDHTETPKVLAVLATTLPLRWDSSNFGLAPADVQRHAAAVGGIDAGQMAFASGAGEEVALFAAWWPWGGGKRISLRVSAFSGASPASAMAGLRQLRQSFGV